MILNVKALGREKPIVSGMDGFWEAAKQWTGAWEGREATI